MKKVLSVLLSVMMVAGLFLALIPTASAAIDSNGKPLTMAEPGELIYSENFEGENLTGKTNHDLTTALGWKQWADDGLDMDTLKANYMKGLNGAGEVSISTNEDNRSLKLKSITWRPVVGGSEAYGDEWGWSMEILNDGRLYGGNYIIEYTTTVLETDKDTKAFGFRNDRCWAYDSDYTDGSAPKDGITYMTFLRANGQSHGLYKGTVSGTGGGWSSVNDASVNLGNLVNKTYTYRTVVSTTDGVHTYVLKDGQWSYHFGMAASATAQYAQDVMKTNNGKYVGIGTGLLLCVQDGMTATFDDISVYTIKGATKIDSTGKPLTMAKPGYRIYSENFEGENLEGKTDNALTKALGYKQWADDGLDDMDTLKANYMKGLNGAGKASINTDKSGNHVLTLNSITWAPDLEKTKPLGDAYGWSMKVFDDARLEGGNYIIEYTATFLSASNTGNGFSFRNDRCYGYDTDYTDNTTPKNGITYQPHIMPSGKTGSQFKGTTSGAGGGWNQPNASSITLGNLINVTNTYRTVVSAADGVHTYVLQDGEWTYYFGMSADAVLQFASDAGKEDVGIGSGLVLALRDGTTATFDDISVYTIKDASTPDVKMEGSQNTIAQGSFCDFRLVGSISDSTDVKYAGFLVSVNDAAEKQVYIKYAYASITTNFGNGSLNAPENGFLGALEITGCPITTKFTVRFFVEYNDGTMLISNETTAVYVAAN